MDPVGQTQVTEHDSATADGASRADLGTARHAHTTGHGGVRADPDVVSDLDEVVEFDSITDHGVIQGTPVDTGIGTDLHIMADVYRAELFNLDPPPLMGGKTKTIGANHHTAVQDAALTDRAASGDCDSRGQAGLRTDPDIASEDAVRSNDSAIADLDAGLNHRVGSDKYTHSQPGRRINHRARMHNGKRFGLVKPAPPLRQPSEIVIRIVGDDAGASPGGRLSQRMADDQGTRPGAVHLGEIPDVGHKRQITLCRRRQRSKTMNGRRRIACQLPTQGINDGAQGCGQGDSGLLGVVQSLDHLVGDIELRIDVGSFLYDQVVLLVLRNLLEHAVDLLEHLLQTLIATQ